VPKLRLLKRKSLWMKWSDEFGADDWEVMILHIVICSL